MSDRDSPEFTPVTRVELKRADFAEVVTSDDLLRTAPVVRALGDQLRRVMKLAIGRRYPDKVPVYRQADAGDSLFLVMRGEARLFCCSGNDTVEVGAAAKGDVFGEEEILSEAGVRQGSAIAAGDLDVIELPRKALVECARQRPELLERLREVLARRQAARDEIAAFINRW